jgi:outer membrane protein assembly factor BamB
LSRVRALRGAPALLACALLIVACGSHSAGTPTTSGTAAATGSAGVTAAAPGSAGDWPQFGFDDQHSGAGPASTQITAADAGRLSLRRVIIDGIADSSAIELHAVNAGGRTRDLIAVTTSYGNTIALDPVSGAKLWEFRPRGVNSSPGNPQVTTASPVADPDRDYLYSASADGRIHKLAVGTGREVWSRSITFDPGHEKIASSLTVSGRFVVAVTGGYFGDAPPYDGHVVAIDRSTGRLAHVWNTECSGRRRLIRASSCPVTSNRGDNAIWGRSGAVIEPGSGRILVATGNGPFDGRSSWGDSVLELSPDATRLLHNWTPTNQARLSAGDTDLGSSSPALAPVYHGRRLAVQGGKDGKLHLLDLDRLDGTRGGAGGRLGGELQEVSTPGGAQLFSQPAVWSHAGRIYLFVADDSGTAAYVVGGGRHPRLQTAWRSSGEGTSPVIAGGLLYVYGELSGRLVIRQPLSGAPVRSLPVETGHWNSPIVVGGRIIEPTGSYHDSSGSSAVDIYHLPGR